MRYIIIILALAGLGLPFKLAAQISGTTNPSVGVQYTYTYNPGVVIFNPMWMLSEMRGTVNSMTQSGTTYTIKITWNTTGPETLAFLDGSVPKATLNITITAPPPPVPVATAATAIGSTSFTANWNLVTGADTYWLDVRKQPENTIVTGYNNSPVSTTSKVVNTNLQANTSYTYVVRSSISGGQQSANSNTITVTTAPAAPPGLTATNVGATSFTANWSAPAGATNYTLEVSQQSNFSAVSQFSTNSTSHVVPGLSGNTTYYWRVRAYNGNWGGFNNGPSVTTAPPPPVLQGPTSTTSTSFDINWQPLSGATHYTIQVDDDSNFGSPHTSTDVSGVTTYHVTGLQAGTVYHYRVKGKNSGWETGYSSAASHITLSNPPGLTQGTTTTTSIVVSWAAVQGAASYVLDVSADNFMTFLPGYNGYAVSTNSVTVSPLAAGGYYQFRARSVNSSGTSGNSTTLSGYTLPPAPVNTPVEVITTTSFNAAWSSVPSATSYTVEVSANNFSSILQTHNTTETTRTITGLSPGTLYYYRVRATNPKGNSTNSTATTVATWLNAPVAIAATSITSTGFTAKWNASQNATSYRLDVSTDPGFTTFFSTYNNMTVSGTSQVVNGLLPKKSYYYRVRAVNTHTTSVNSNTITAVDLDQNYVRIISVTVPAKTTWTQAENAAINESVTQHEFVDGLGRPVQKVTKQGSPAQKDIVEPMDYDVYGRQVYSYLPYTDETSGWFKVDALRSPTSTGTPRAQYMTGKQYNFYQSTPLIEPSTYPLAETRFEASPANRPIEQGAPGVTWQPDATNTYASTDRTVKSAYETNVASEVLRWTYGYPSATYPLGLVHASNGATPVYYAAGTLIKSKTKDEDGNEVIEYKDKLGNVILKRVQAATGTPAINDSNYASTYYVHDATGNLVAVIPPQATSVLPAEYHNKTNAEKNAFLSRWAFRYAYDARRRMTHKQVPGAEAVYMVYDKRDRLVITQDAVQRAANKWTFTKYDILNRVIMTGLYTHGSTVNQQAMQTHVNTQIATGNQFYEDYNGTVATHGYTNRVFPTTSTQPLVVNYYDTYKFRTDLTLGTAYDFVTNHLSGQNATSFNQVTGLVTGTKVNVLNTSNYLWTVTYYDDRYRAIQVAAQNNKGGLDRVTNIYDFTGKVLTTKTTHSTASQSTDIVRNFAYDHAKRLLKTYHKIGSNATVLLSSTAYNELGQAVTRKLHSTDDGTTFKQHMDYRYNIRGWLTRINNSDLNTTDGGPNDYFGMNLGYEAAIGTGNAAQYGGNISGVKWSVNQGYATIKQLGYNFTYDPLSRLLNATGRKFETAWAAGGYDENVTAYDLNGNIKTLVRKTVGGTTIDNLTYNYGTGTTASNKLLYVQDNTSNAIDKSKGFLDGQTGTATDYTYDVNGNMTRDLNKGIGTTLSDAVNLIAYNHLNLPETVTKGGNTVRYIYDATGRKLAQEVTHGSTLKRTDYVGEFTYENDQLQFIAHEEGRAVTASERLVLTDAGKDAATMTAVSATLTAITDTGNGEKYVQIQSNGTTLSGAFPVGGPLTVLPGERYRIRVKGYSTGANAVYIAVQSNGTNLNWPGAQLPAGKLNEAWTEQVVTIPGSGGSVPLTVGVKWNTATSGDRFFLNELEVLQLQSTTPEYQYHLKDHLGNVRVTFTSKNETESVTATLETAPMTTEKANFLRYNNAKRVNASIFDRTNGASPGYSQRLSGRNNEKYGLARSLSVMPGDVIDMEVYVKYVDPVAGNRTTALNTLLSQIAANAAGVVVDGVTYASSTSTFPFPGLVTGTPASGAPKAYLNWLIFDRNYTFKDGGFQAMQGTAKEAGTDVPHELISKSITIKEPGYVYIYYSNDELNSSPVEVFFDDFKVTQSKLPIVQADDYYPFGLTFNSYQRENSVYNKFQYNGKELQSELGLNWNDYGARMYMSDIGRWGVVDPLADLGRRWSPYTYALDNPIRFIDPDGMVANEASHLDSHRAWMAQKVAGPCGDQPCPQKSGERTSAISQVKERVTDKSNWKELGNGLKKFGSSFVKNFGLAGTYNALTKVMSMIPTQTDPPKDKSGFSVTIIDKGGSGPNEKYLPKGTGTTSTVDKSVIDAMGSIPGRKYDGPNSLPGRGPTPSLTDAIPEAMGSAADAALAGQGSYKPPVDGDILRYPAGGPVPQMYPSGPGHGQRTMTLNDSTSILMEVY